MILADAAFQCKKRKVSFPINNKTEYGKILMEGQLQPVSELAVARTVLANQRTLLAVVRTALGCFLGGAGLFKFFGHPVYEIVGIMLMIISAAILFVGIRKYWAIKMQISDIDPEDWQGFEALVEKDRMSKG
jgi:inner membrane protein YidH